MSSTNGRRIVAQLDLDALRQNVRELRRRAEGVPLMPAVKADAYGHGIEHVVPVLRSEGVEAFGVADVSEGLRLRKLGVEEPVLVFADPPAELIGDCAQHRLDVTVGSTEALRAVLATRAELRVHLKVDTGMHRLGFAPEEVAAAVEALAAADHAELVAVWTHLATADERDVTFAHEQVERFNKVVGSLGREVPTHVANSGAIVQVPAAVQGRSFVRPGGLVYGLPSTTTLAQRFDARPVMRLVSRVVALRTVAAGESVSYGRTWRAQTPAIIATISAGYGDGLPRQLSNSAEVAIAGRRYPVAGRVCMDMMMIDLGPPEGTGAGTRVGDEVVIFGPGGPTSLEAAAASDTIAYDFTTGLTERVPRIPA